MNIAPRIPLQPRDIGLILSYRCQAACAHCLYNCGPGWRDWMTPEAVREALARAKNVWGAGFQVHLTGGEPFLNYPLLLEATGIASGLEIPVYLETNGGWFRDVQKAEDRFRELREAGLGAVLVSVSPFHQEAIPLGRTLDAISAARAVFGGGRVMVYQSDWLPELSRHGLKDRVPLERYMETYGKTQAGLHLWINYGLISGGRAGYRLGEWVPRRPVESFKGETCAEELLHAQHSHLDLYGNFIPAFCGGMRLGDWHDLSELIADYRQGQVPPLIATLLREGPYGLFRQAQDECGYEPLAAGYTGKCHLCVDVRKHLVRAGAHPETLTPPQFYESF
ncbi:MAG: radical SAM protein [Brevefilum sp.]